MENHVRKLALFQYKCDLNAFEEIFESKENARHMYEKFISFNRNLLKFTDHLDESNLSKLTSYITKNMNPI